MGWIGECQRGDEQAHGKTDAAKHANAQQLWPTGSHGLFCHAGRQRKPAGGDNAERFADDKARGNSERHGPSSQASVAPASETPALAKANSGKIAKATKGCSRSSRRSSSGALYGPASARGMAAATTTPASVA